MRASSVIAVSPASSFKFCWQDDSGELHAVASRLTSAFDAIKRAGFVPWTPFGQARALSTRREKQTSSRGQVSATTARVDSYSKSECVHMHAVEMLVWPHGRA